jgi:lipoate-protein ligase A
MPIRVLTYETPRNPHLNLAFEEALARVRAKDLVEDTLRIWRNEKALVLGYFRNAEDDINLLRAKEMNFSIVRRFSGGGTVYHDLGCVNYSIVIKRSVRFPVSYLYNELLKGTLIALKKLGIKPHIKNTNDIVVNGKKISGTAGSIKWNVLFLHGSILINSDLNMLYFLLKVPKSVKDSIDPVKYRVANLSRFVEDLNYEKMRDALIFGYSKVLSAKPYFDNPTKKELKVAQILYKQKYSKEEWNLKRSPNIDTKKIERKIEEVLG